tara:strand:+ start:4653 stop:5819 length:1167 start_codon:yes stop_codon:yes gene_type:complete
MIKNKTKISSIFIVFLVLFSLSVFAYNKYKSEILVFINLQEIKDPKSNKFYFSTKENKRLKISIPVDSKIEDVIKILNKSGELKGEKYFHALAETKDYSDNIVSGSIHLRGKYSLNQLINTLMIVERETYTLYIPENIRLIDTLFYRYIEDSLGFNAGSIKEYLKTSDFLNKSVFNTNTIPTLFIPNTYEVYADISVEEFFIKMQNEYHIFWNQDRLNKLDSLNLLFHNCSSINEIPKNSRISQIDVSILASIIEAEQDKKIDERPMISGLYLNRLMNTGSFPYLQADPTVIFANYISGAINDFNVKQVLDIHLEVDNEYNTYMYKGLPPGPIRIPSIHAIESVLNSVKHDFYFMCAGSNGDGYHKFTKTNREHNINKQNYKKYQNFN